MFLKIFCIFLHQVLCFNWFISLILEKTSQRVDSECYLWTNIFDYQDLNKKKHVHTLLTTLNLCLLVYLNTAVLYSGQMQICFLKTFIAPQIKEEMSGTLTKQINVFSRSHFLRHEKQILNIFSH